MTNRIVVDTSVWIDFFKGTLPESLLQNLLKRLGDDLVCITDIIRHEIRMGAKDKKQYAQLTRLLKPIPCLWVPPEAFDAFEDFSWQARQKGLQGKYTDLSIAFLSHTHQIPLLSFDDYFHRLAEKGMIELI